MPERRYRYRAYGLVLDVPFPCPALIAETGEGGADVVLTEGPVPRSLPDPEVVESGCEAAPGLFLLRGGPRGGRFLVSGGDVTLERNPGADDTVLARLLTDRVMAALLSQRGLLVLHANAASTERGAVVIAGESGAGKSTTLSALIAAGATMLSDDVTAISLDDQGHPVVLPGAAQLDLTEDAAEALALDITGALLQPWRRMKAAVHTHARMAEEAAPLAGIYVLRTGPTERVWMRRLSGADAFDALQSCIYGPTFGEERETTFPILQATVAAGIFHLERPAEAWSVPDVVQAILGGPSEAPA